MARRPIRPPWCFEAPEDFILPEDWSKNLKFKFNDDLRNDIELKVDRYIIHHLLKINSLSFDDIEDRLNEIIECTSRILKICSNSLPKETSDNVHDFIEWEITSALGKLNSRDPDVTLGSKMRDIFDLKQAATSTLVKLKASHPTLPAHRPTDDNADWLIYDLGLIFEQAGGNFAMPKSPSPNHPFYCYLQTINQFIPEELQLNDSNIINRSIKLIRDRKNNDNK